MKHMTEAKKTNVKIVLTAVILLSGAYYIHSQASSRHAGKEDLSVFNSAHADIKNAATGK